MENTPNSNQQWQFVADELRAYKQYQEETWGDLDDSIIGKYLAGEASQEEARQIQSHLSSHPELQQLVDLVSEVMGDYYTESPNSITEPATEKSPTIVPFVPSSPEQPSLWQMISSFVQRRAPLMAAACLIIAIGFVAVNLPDIQMSKNNTDLALNYESPDSNLESKKNTPSKAEHSIGPVALNGNNLILRLNRPVVAALEKGEIHKAFKVAHEKQEEIKSEYGINHPDYYETVNQLAMLYEAKGDKEEANKYYRYHHYLTRHRHNKAKGFKMMRLSPPKMSSPEDGVNTVCGAWTSGFDVVDKLKKRDDSRYALRTIQQMDVHRPPRGSPNNALMIAKTAAQQNQDYTSILLRYSLILRRQANLAQIQGEPIRKQRWLMHQSNQLLDKAVSIRKQYWCNNCSALEVAYKVIQQKMTVESENMVDYLKLAGRITLPDMQPGRPIN